MHERAKELIKQLAAELEFVTIPAIHHECNFVYGGEDDRKREDYEKAKDLQNDLKQFYYILRNY